MNAFQLLEEARDVAPVDEATLDAAIDRVLTEAFADVGLAPSLSAMRRRRRREIVRDMAAVAVALTAAIIAVVVIPGGGRHGTVSGTRRPPPSTTLPSRHSRPHNPAVLAASTVRHIAAASTATADSGTAVVAESTAAGTPPVTTQTMTFDVTFSGKNVDYTNATNADGAQGVHNRYVDGQLYLYVEGPDRKMHWYHTLDPGSGAGKNFFDPRTLFHALKPSAGLEVVGQQTTAGVALTHLHATNPSSIPVGSALGIKGTTGPVKSFDVWIDHSDVVHKMTIVFEHDSRACVRASCTTIKTTPGTRTSTVVFSNLGAPESVTVPVGAIPLHGLG